MGSPMSSNSSFINNEDSPALETLLGLVSHYSPSGQEDLVTQWLIERMRVLGYTQSFRDKVGNAIGIIGNGAKQLLFLGHIDTVIGEIPVQMNGNLLYARGAVDAKASLAAFVHAVAAIGAMDGWQFVVVGAVDEEGDSRGARNLLTAFQPAYVIAGEPNSYRRIALGYKGSLKLCYSITQPVSHSAHNVKSAFDQLAEFWFELQKRISDMNQERPSIFEQIQTTIRGWNSIGDGFKETASITVQFRLPPGINPSQIFELTHITVHPVQVQEIGQSVPGFKSGKRNPLVRSFLHAIRQAGDIPEFVYKTGSSDVSIVSSHWNCDSIVYGPGDSNQDHTPNEHLDIIEYYQSIEIIKQAVTYLVAHP